MQQEDKAKTANMETQAPTMFTYKPECSMASAPKFNLIGTPNNGTTLMAETVNTDRTVTCEKTVLSSIVPIEAENLGIQCHRINQMNWI